MWGAEYEVLVRKNGNAVTRSTWLEALNSVPGREVMDPCSRQLIGKRTNLGLLKTDTTSAILELSISPTNSIDGLLRAFAEFHELIQNNLNFEIYDKAYLPFPSLEWYLKNATPRGHYRLLQWYGYEHWRISRMASTQIWIDVRPKDLPCVLNAINNAAPWLLSKFSNSPCCGWKEYRVASWILFARRSWASIPNVWAPKSFTDWTDVVLDILSGKPQEAEGCKDLSMNNIKELAHHLSVNGFAPARDINMGIVRASTKDMLKGMQRWTFRPAIARWSIADKVRDDWLERLLLDKDISPFLNTLSKTFIEVRFPPYLEEERLLELLLYIESISKNCEASPTLDSYTLRYWYVKAAKGETPPRELSEWVERVIRR